MKLKRILSALLVMSVMAVSSVSVYAVDYSTGTETFTIGNPIDLETGDTVEVSDIEAEQLLAFPVDIQASSTAIPNYQFIATYDTDYLSPGIDTSLISNSMLGGFGVNETALGTLKAADNDSTKYMCIDAFGTSDPIYFYGYYSFSSVFTMVTSYTGTNTVTVAAANASDVTISTTHPEFYVLFTAKADVSSDALNLNLFEVNYDNSAITVNGTSLHGITATQEQANACYGAFTVSVDNEAYAVAYGEWITDITAYIYTDSNKGTAIGSTSGYALTEYVNDDGSSVYSFPTRITAYSDNESAYVEIVATTNSESDGSGDAGTRTLGAKTISLDGTVTSYDDVAATE